MNRSEFINAVEMYSDDVFRIALSYCNNKSDAEDITQNTFLKLLQSDESFESVEHIKKWLLRVAINNCKDIKKSFWQKNILPLDDLTETEGAADFTQNDYDLYNAVTKLQSKYRIVVHLFYYEDYPIKEISELLGIKETTVQTRLMRARRKLKELLEG